MEENNKKEFEQISNAVIVNLLVKDMLKLRYSIQCGKLESHQTQISLNAYNLEACVLEAYFDPNNPHLLPETLNSVKELLEPDALTLLSPISDEVN